MANRAYGRAMKKCVLDEKSVDAAREAKTRDDAIVERIHKHADDYVRVALEEYAESHVRLGASRLESMRANTSTAFNVRYSAKAIRAIWKQVRHEKLSKMRKEDIAAGRAEH